MSEKVRIFKKNVHFFVVLYAHFQEKCVTLHLNCAKLGYA